MYKCIIEFIKQVEEKQYNARLAYYYITFLIQVIDKGFFSEAFLFKPRGGRSPPSGLNRKPRKNPLFSL